LSNQGCTILPNPNDPIIQDAFRSDVINSFERHSRQGFIDEDAFLRSVECLRKAGVQRILLKTGACSAIELACALKWSSKAKADVLTIDGFGGSAVANRRQLKGEFGIPVFHLQSMAYKFAEKLAANGDWVPDIALAGEFSSEDHIFKVLALGAPHFRCVCMGEAMMIPGFVGDNIEGVLRNTRQTKWTELPNTISIFGDKPEHIFVTYETLAKRLGRDKADKLPLSAVAMHTYIDKLRMGLIRLMAGTRNFRLATMKRSDLIALTEEAAKISGIPYVMDAGMNEAEEILKS
jgi:glutamate synthase domain-containing protein 2